MSSQLQPQALITGAAQRIGEDIARHLHGRGLDVLLHYRNSDVTAAGLAAELNQLRSHSAGLIQADLARPEDLDRMIETVLDHGKRLQLLVNNASGFYPTPFGQVSGAEWKSLMGSNLRGPFFLCQGLAPLLAEHAGSIINIIDIHARKPLRDHPVYCIAKAGLEMMTLSLAKELGPAVRVNGVAPGAILWPDGMAADTRHRIIEQTALRRQGEAADISGAVAFLALDAPYVTGQVLAVDGGRSLNL